MPDYIEAVGEPIDLQTIARRVGRTGERAVDGAFSEPSFVVRLEFGCLNRVRLFEPNLVI